MLKEKIGRMLRAAFDRAAASGLLKPSGIPAIPVDVPREKGHGDLYSSLPFILSRELSMPPGEISGIILKNFRFEDEQGARFVEKAEIGGKGFLNFFIDRDYLRANLCKIIALGPEYGSSDSGKGKKCQVEFASVGPTGPIHIGHARGAVVGDVLANVLKKAGYVTEKEYYVNDVGTQIDILGRSLKARYLELCGSAPEPVENGYEGGYLVDIAGMIKDRFGKDCIDKGIDFFSSFAVKEILEGIKKDLDSFGVSFDRWVPESGLYRSGEVSRAIEALKARGKTTEKDGALWLNAPSSGNPEEDKENVLVRSSGTPTYFASDIAYHCNKFNRGFDAIIDIWGQDHHGHVKRLRDAVSALGCDPAKLEIILYQLVSLTRKGSPVRMSTRKGEFITLKEVMGEVGKDAVRFFFLMRKVSSHLNFDLELAKEQSMENPVYYVQYAYARICSVFREADKRQLKAESSKLKVLNEEAEIELMRKLAFFPDEIAIMAEAREPHGLTVYAQEIAALFHRFYTECRIVGEDRDLAEARLTLVKAVQTVLSCAMELIGIEPKEKM